MRSLTKFGPWLAVLALTLASTPAWAEDGAEPQGGADQESRPQYGGVGGLSLSGDAGYYTYGMDDVNARYGNGGGNAINGGLGYGGGLALGFTNRLAARVGLDYLQASRGAVHSIGGTEYTTTVNLPATVLFIGGEYVLVPLRILNVKLIGGYTLVTIHNGDESTDGGNSLDLGAVTGSGSGFQVGLGVEAFLANGFSLEADLAYDYAKIANATFAGSAADPGSTGSNGVVDYSGLVAKLAFNIYLLR